MAGNVSGTRLGGQEGSTASYERIWAKTAETCSVTIDVISIVRNSLASTNFPKVRAIAGLGLVGGALGIASGGFIVRDGVKGVKTAYDHGDREGGALALGVGAMGASYSVVGAGMVTNYSAPLFHATAAAGVGAAMITFAGFIMYGVVALLGLGGLAIHGSFRSELADILSRAKEGEREKLYKALTWIQEKTTGPEPEGKWEKKWDQFSRRTSGEVSNMVRTLVTPDLLKKIEEGDSQSIALAHAIVNEVSKESFKKLVKSALLLIIAIVGILAFVGGIVLAGPYSSILFVIGAMLWLFVDSKWLHEQSSHLLWKIRNEIWSEWDFDVKGKVCPLPLLSPISSTTSDRNGDFRSIPLTPIAEMSKRLNVSFRKNLGLK